MTYTLNVISVASDSARTLQAGGRTAEPDVPPIGRLEVAGHQIAGARHLIVADDGEYRSSVQLAAVPHNPGEAITLIISEAFQSAFWELLGNLQRFSTELKGR